MKINTLGMRFGEWRVPLNKECPTRDEGCHVPTRNTWMGCAMELWNVRGGILLAAEDDFHRRRENP